MTAATFVQPDGLHLSAQTTLSQLFDEQTLHPFADNLLHMALSATLNIQPSMFNIPLAEVLHYTGGPETYPLLTALLALDAEVHSVVDEERRVLPLSGFLSYRDRLPLDKVPLETVRLPPLNAGGRYAFTVLDGKSYLAVRLDLHEILRVAGHVRIALSSPVCPPLRLHAIEDRLERQIIEAELIEVAVTKGNEGLTVLLTPSEQTALIGVLKIIAI